jgi:hypothetical protein
MYPGTSAAGRHPGRAATVGWSGGVMRFIVIRDGATLEEIDEGLNALWVKAQRACIPSTRVEIMQDINELLEMRGCITAPSVLS